MKTRPRISVIVPNHNGAETIRLCLESILASDHDAFEVIVVDDASTDASLEVIRQFPCRLVELTRHSGAGRARSVGALNSSGSILFFTDADCLLQRDTLGKAEDALHRLGKGVVVGGTYTPIPFDRDFFSLFQSVFIHHSELRRGENADYVAGHAMAIPSKTFWKTGGFPENRLPILEDVEYSHRLKGMGYRLVILPDILVQHIFNFSLFRSLRNGWRKSLYWTLYSLSNRDLCSDSGTASRNLKLTVAVHAFTMTLLMFQHVVPPSWTACLVPAAGALVLWTNRNLLRAFFRASGAARAGLLFMYYVTIYPFAVGAGAVQGYIRHLWGLSPRRQKTGHWVPVSLPVRADEVRRECREPFMPR